MGDDLTITIPAGQPLTLNARIGVSNVSAGRAIIEDILFTFDPLEGQHYQLDTVIKVQPNLFFDTYATLENLDSGNKISVAQRKFTYSKPIRCLDLYDDIPEDNYVIKMESKKIKAR